MYHSQLLTTEYTCASIITVITNNDVIGESEALIRIDFMLGPTKVKSP